MEKYIVVRFEENIAVLEKENGEMINVSKELVNGKENDVVFSVGEGYAADEGETRKRKSLIKEKMKKVFRN